MKKKVLILTGFYTPSVKGGGPIQSIKNLVDNLSGKLEFYILTSDRDLGDKESFSNIKVNEWIQVGNAKVYYTPTSNLTLKRLVEIINDINCDSLYLNGFFIYKFSIAPIILHKLKRITPPKIIIAPRGEFSKGALSLKRTKKNVFISTSKLMGLYKDVIWHATAETEKKDIESIFGASANIQVANNLTANYKSLKYTKNIGKKNGELKIVFISRIHRKKNLKKAIDYLRNINGNVEFNIYGPLEDKVYWNECEKLMELLPENIRVSYKGAANHRDIIKIFKNHHVFLFPTLGENFGHVISEALIGGCPVILSDQTPWRNLRQKQVGWDLPLSDESKFIESIQYCIDLDEKEYYALSKKAFEYGKNQSNSTEDMENSYELFLESSNI